MAKLTLIISDAEDGSGNVEIHTEADAEPPTDPATYTNAQALMRVACEAIDKTIQEALNNRGQ